MPCANVQPADVRNLVTTSLEDPDLQTFIDDAWDLVQDSLTGKGVSASLMDRMTKYLAAHFVTLRDVDRRQIEYRAGQKAEKFQAVTREDGIGDFAETAISLDPTGCLAKRLTGRPVMTFAVGRLQTDA